MAFTKTITSINEEMVFLEREATLVDGSIKKIDEVLKRNPVNSLDQIPEIDTDEILAAYIALYSNMTYDEAYINIEGIETPDDIDTIVQIVDLQERGTEDILALAEAAALKSTVSEADFQRVSKLYKNDKKAFINALDFWARITEITDSYRQISTAYESNPLFKASIEGSGKNKKSIVKEYVYSKHEVDEVYKIYREMVNKCDDRKRKERSLSRNANRRMNDYHRLMELLNGNRLEYGKTFDDCLSLIGNPDMEEVFVKEFQEYLQGKYSVAKEKYDSLNDNGDTKLKALFNDLGLKFSELDEDTKKYIVSLDYEQVRLICEAAQNLKVNDINVYVYLIINSTPEIVNRFTTDISEGKINRQFVLDNLGLLSTDKENGIYYKHYLRVVTLIKEKNINLRLFEQSSEIYTVDLETVNRNLNILDNYGLLNYLKTCETFTFFDASDLEYRIDALLELGLENVLVNHLDILKYPYSLIKRLYAYRSIGESIESYEDVLEILNSKSPIVPDNELDEYISNIVDIEISEELRNGYTYSEIPNGNNSLTLSINGILVSRNRVERNRVYLEDKELTKEEKEYYAFIMNGLYSYEDLRRIKEIYTGDNKRMN